MTTDRPPSTLLSAPGARPLLASSIVARLPLAMFSIALLVHAQRLTGSFAIAGLVCSAYAICGAVSAPVLGRLVDRRGQTRVVAGGSVLTASFLICIGLLPAGTAAAGLVALAACAGLSTPPLEACVRTLLPTITARPSDLRALFALESTVLELTFVFGPPLALGLGAAWSTGAALVVSGLVMIAGAGAFALQPSSRSWRPNPLQTRRPAGSLQSNAIRVLIAIDLGTGIVFGATEVGVTATAKQLAAAAAAAPILGLWGLGSLLGGIVTTRIGGGAKSVPGLVALILVLAVTHGALLLGTDSLPVMGVIILLAGATIAPTGSSLYALVDRTAPAGTHTEAFSWLAAASSTGAAIGAAIAGVLAQGAGPAAVFAFAGTTGIAAAAVALHQAHQPPAPEPIRANRCRRDGARPGSPAMSGSVTDETRAGMDEPASEPLDDPIGNEHRDHQADAHRQNRQARVDWREAFAELAEQRDDEQQAGERSEEPQPDAEPREIDAVAQQAGIDQSALATTQRGADERRQQRDSAARASRSESSASPQPRTRGREREAGRADQKHAPATEPVERLLSDDEGVERTLPGHRRHHGRGAIESDRPPHGSLGHMRLSIN